MQSTVIIGVDAGNSAVKMALIREGNVDRDVAVPTHPVEDLGRRLFAQAPASFKKVCGGTTVLIGSVCPEANGAIEGFFKDVLPGSCLFFLRNQDIPLPVSARIKDPRGVGVDRLTGAYAASGIYGCPCIVVSAGSAITVDLVGDSGEFEGGAISVGFGLSARALGMWTSALPQVRPARPEAVCGRDTVEAMQSGIYHACCGGVHELIRKFSEQCHKKPVTVLTGGDMGLFDLQRVKTETVPVPGLIFKGMWRLYRTEGVGR